MSKCLKSDLFFRLGLLHILSTHFDPGSEDGPSELQHIDAKQVAQFLSSCVIRHWGLVMVLLLHEGNVPKLEHSRDHLKHGWGEVRQGDGKRFIARIKFEKKPLLFLSSRFLHIFSSGLKPIIPMESMVWVKFSESLWPGTGMDPPVRKRYSSAVPKSRSANNRNKKDETERQI